MNNISSSQKMKFLIVFCSVAVCVLAKSLPKVKIATDPNLLKAATAVGRIINGQPADENQIPHQCAILSPIGGAFAVCGGSIISTTWVMTAAHCTVGYSQHNLRFGSLRLTSGGYVQTAFDAISHPDFDPDTYNFNIAVIAIPTPLVLSVAIQSIRLPTRSQIGSTFVDRDAIVSGWGADGTNYNQILNWVDMRVIANNVCADYYGRDVVADHVLCGEGFFSPGNQGHCGADVGGALTILEGGVRTQIGIVSFSPAAGCTSPFPSGYTRTPNFVEWVFEQTGIPVRP